MKEVWRSKLLRAQINTTRVFTSHLISKFLSRKYMFGNFCQKFTTIIILGRHGRYAQCYKYDAFKYYGEYCGVQDSKQSGSTLLNFVQ